MTVTAPTEETVNKHDENTLLDVKSITEDIREHQRAIERLSKNRKEKILRLRDHRITYREIAEAMGTTEQNVYKILRASIAAERTAE